MMSFRFILAANQGLIALIGQENLMSGRPSTLSSVFYQVALILAAFASGVISENLSPARTFSWDGGVSGVDWLVQFVASAPFWALPHDQPQAQGSISAET